MPRIPIYKRQLVINYLNDGLNMIEIFRKLKIAPNSANRLNKKFLNKNTLFDLPKSGRRPIFSQRNKLTLPIDSKFHLF
jgi:hypothetical protein